MENITVNNVDITNLVTSFEVYEEMDKDLIIGSAISTQIKLKLRNRDNQLEGLLDYPFIIDNKTYLVFEKPEKWTKSVSLTLYDKMILTNVAYDTKLEYPVALSDQLDEISQIIGIAIDKATLSSQLLSKEVNWYDNTIIIRNYIGFIAQCDGKNAFIENDKIVFKGLTEQSHTTDFCSDYELNELITFSRVCFDDGLNILAKGDDTDKTLYVSSNNSYIEQSDIDRIYSMYNGLSFYSFKKFKCKDVGIKLTDLLSYGDITIMPLSIKRRVYGGEAKDSVELSGDITIKNADSVIVKENASLKIKRIQTIVDQNKQTLQIVAKKQDELGSQQAEFKLSLDEIKETVKKTDENVEMIFKDFNVYLETNITASQIYDSNANTYIPDFFTNNLVIAANAYGIDGNEIQNVKYEWKRKTENGHEPLEAGEHVNDNVLTISHNFGESVTFVCTATLDLISKKEELTVISTKTGKDGQDGKLGPQGPQGIQGPKGENGRNSYFHVKYSQNANGNPMSDSAVDAIYIGVVVTEGSTAPENYTSYSWSKIKGEVGPKGETGTIGPKGSDGKTSYLHIKYSDNGTTFTSNNGETPGKYIGTYVDFTESDSSVFNDYTWVKVEGPQGVQGPKGTDGKQYYTWLKYADTPTTGMSDNPTGKAYIGLAYNKETSTESNNYSDYTWSLIKGPKGDQGVAGGKGADGTTFYTWIKYATSSSGVNMSDDPAGKTYIGLAYNKTTPTESTNAADYTWSLIKGDKGDKGDAGKGIKSTAITYQAGTSGTTAPTGTWATAIPSVPAGQYLWSKTVITYTDNTTSTTYSVAYIPKNGTNGATGATGTGVNTIVQQYYLSTSKTEQSGGSWVTAMPTWSTGLYLWTRYAITYKNPTSTAYTSPICDSSWEAVNDLETDMNEKFDEAANDLATQLNNAKAEFSSQIVKTADSIKQEVSTTYYAKKDGEKLAERATKLEQDSQSWTFNFESLTKQLAGLDKEQKENYARILKYIRFEDGNIILGESDNALTLTIQNDKIVFKQSDKELAYFTNGKLYVTDGEFTQSLRIGNYAFVPRSNGSLDFKKVG